MGSIKSSKAPASPAKVTRAHIQAKKEETVKKKEVDKTIVTHLDTPLVENINRMQIDGEEARNIDEAIQILGYVCILSMWYFKIKMNLQWTCCGL